jgi:hypothetical protein
VSLEPVRDGWEELVRHVATIEEGWRTATDVLEPFAGHGPSFKILGMPRISLPRVTALTHERVSREFDDRGLAVCRTEITLELEANNPELLDMAMRCASDVGDPARIMTGFCMFYRLLTAEARDALGALRNLGDKLQPDLLPRVLPATRTSIVQRIDAVGSTEFTRETIAELERNNPELLFMGHNFAEHTTDYVGVMQGFALLYACLLTEAAQTRGSLH